MPRGKRKRGACDVRIWGETMTSHTPGPWTTGRDSASDWQIHPAITDGNPIAIVRTEANARLIAAAPDLLAALTFALDVDTQARVGEPRPRDPAYQESYDRAVAAVAKAMGEPDSGLRVDPVGLVGTEDCKREKESS